MPETVKSGKYFSGLRLTHISTYITHHTIVHDGERFENWPKHNHNVELISSAYLPPLNMECGKVKAKTKTLWVRLAKGSVFWLKMTLKAKYPFCQHKSLS